MLVLERRKEGNFKFEKQNDIEDDTNNKPRLRETYFTFIVLHKTNRNDVGGYLIEFFSFF